MLYIGYCHPSVSVCYGCQLYLKMNCQQTPPPLDLAVLTQMRLKQVLGSHVSLSLLLYTVDLYEAGPVPSSDITYNPLITLSKKL